MKSEMFFILLFTILFCSCQSSVDSLDEAINGMIKSEVDFSELSKNVGRKTAFLQNLTDSSLMLLPKPGYGKPRYENIDDIPGELLWYPEYADISKNGILGITMGPYIFYPKGDTTIKYYGHYLTIWEKYPEIGWKINFDAGIGYSDFNSLNIKTTFNLSNELSNNKSGNKEQDIKVIISDLNNSVRIKGERQAFSDFLTPTSKIFRDGIKPTDNLDENLALFSENIFEVEYAAYRFKVNEINDFAYEIGIMEMIDVVDSSKYRNSFCRIWKNNDSGWKIAADFRLPLE